MQKQAIIYTRVSTDEQADKGYSLRDQEDRLRKYCALKNIEVVMHFQDDHSAKTFGRPGFNNLLDFLKLKKTNINLLLFIKWDRFSRNAGDSYSMINTLGRFNVEPQAIEQPLDLEIPENKMMLAFYLASPEVENDRRSLNIIHGVRRAKKEGRWLGPAPMGYKNIRDEKNKPIIVPNEKAMLIQKAFKEIAKGIYSQQEVRRDLVSQGLKVSKNRFSRLLRDPLYLGKIKVTAFKDEPVHYVEGIHEGLIEAELFYKVQDVLNNKRPKFPPVYKRDAMLPLRGHLLCNTCGGNLTGSKSKGNGGKYYYYHCQKGCKVRYKADQLNDEFETLLGSMKVEKEVVDVFYEIVKSQLKGTDGKANKIAKIEDKIKKEEARICKLQDLMLDGDISNAEYNNMKKRYEESINHLSIEKIDVQSFDDTFQEYLNFGLNS